MRKIALIQTLLLIVLITVNTNAQTGTGEEKNIQEALLHPEKVIRLDLSNQNISTEKIDFSRFVNLEYLSLENDHLQELPKGIGSLKKLKTLNSMSVAAYTNQKKQKQIRNWKKQYGIVIETDEQFKFFKENRAMVLKTLPIYEQMIKHFPTIIKQSNINF